MVGTRLKLREAVEKNKQVWTSSYVEDRATALEAQLHFNSVYWAGFKPIFDYVSIPK